MTQLETACRAARNLPASDDEEAQRRRYLRWVRDDNGTFRLSGRLHGVDGLTLTNLLAAMAETAHPEPDPVTGAHDPFETRCADALVDLCTETDDEARVKTEVVIHVPVDAVRPDDDGADASESQSDEGDGGATGTMTAPTPMASVPGGRAARVDARRR